MRKSVPDAVIVGAGPAGSTAAFLLASNGLRVQVLDRSHFPREKLCGGLLTWKTIQTLAAAFGVTAATLKSEKIIRVESRGYLVGGRNSRPIHGTLDYPFHLVERKAYDEFWLKRAVSAGAEFRPGTRAMSFNPATRQVVTADGEILHARFVLGADGVASRVRSALRRAGKIADPRGGETAIAIETFATRRRDRHRHRNLCAANCFRRLPGPPLPALRLYPLGICLVFSRTRMPGPRHPRAEE
jgi:flavin-dependent dehydrogenase